MGADEKMRDVMEWLIRDLDTVEECERLGERIWPILLAGQAMRYEIVESSASHTDSGKQCPICLSVQAWDAALAAAQGQPENTR